MNEELSMKPERVLQSTAVICLGEASGVASLFNHALKPIFLGALLAGKTPSLSRVIAVMTPTAMFRFLTLLALLLLVGCTHQLQFHVVEASTGNNLANVRVRLRDAYSMFSHGPPTERYVGLTDTNGFIAVSGVSSRQTILFWAQDFHGAIAGFVAHGRVGYRPDPPLNVDSLWREQTVVDSSGVIAIPLQPKQR